MDSDYRMHLATTVQNRVSAGNESRKKTDTRLKVDFRMNSHVGREVSRYTFEEKKDCNAAGEVDAPHHDPDRRLCEEGKQHHDGTQPLEETTQHTITA